jgi:Holliday junction resolvase
MSGPTESVFREPAVEEILIGHLKQSGYRVVTRPPAPSGYPDIVADGPDGKWVIEVKGEDSGGYTSADELPDGAWSDHVSHG